MENNNGWYGDNDQYGRYAGGGYQQPVKKKEGRKVSLACVIALMAVTAILGLAAGAGIFYLGMEQRNESALAPVSEPAVQEETVIGAGSPSNESETTDSQASQGLNMGALHGETAEQSGTLQASMASVVGIESATGSGSGVIVTENGYIVTNNHVVAGSGTVTVYLQDGTGYEAKVVGADTYTDLAIIKIDANGLPAAELGDSASVTVGSDVYAIGNPLGVLACSVSSGIVSGLDRTVEIDGISMTLMQTDAAVNPGNSGGGLFSADGTLVGIINAKSTGLDVEGLGFAIPIDSAKPVIADLMDYGFVTGRPYLGIMMQDISTAASPGSDPYGFGSYGLGGFSFGGYVTRVMVTAVEEGSAAYNAGLKANDIILKLNGDDVQGYTALSAALYVYQPGDVVTLTIQRGDSTMDIQLTLGSRTTG